MFIKKGQALVLSSNAVQSTDQILADAELVSRFEKFAAELKAIAPKAQDFLYFTAVMMHAAEASLLDDNGDIKKQAVSGDYITSNWEKVGDSWKWVCSDPTILPYKNANNDIFPEEELVKAHKKWVGRPLCLDHKSDSVDHIRGVVVDTYYDEPKKRVIALCALDKKNYPDLARKVESKYATSVSMGTAVGKAICSDCGNVARVEADFCNHMRNKTCYGEINVDLKPIELSIVVNGADPKAQIKYVMAAANSISKYIDQKEEAIEKIAMNDIVDSDTISGIRDNVKGVLVQLEELESQADKVEVIEEAERTSSVSQDAGEKEAYFEATIKMANILGDLKGRVDQLQNTMDNLQKNSEEHNMSKKQAYFQGGGGDNEPTPGKPKYPVEDYVSYRDKEDKQMVGQMNTGPVGGMHPGYDSHQGTEEARKRELQRMAEAKEERAIRRQAIVDRVQSSLDRKAYFQGGGDVNEPTPGKPKYPVEDYVGYRDKEDKQMNGQPPFPDVGAIDGLHPSPASCDVKDELKRKQMLSRADTLRGKFYKAANPDGSDNLGKCSWQIFSNDKLILTATVDELTGGKADVLYDSVATKQFGRKILDMLRTQDFDKVASMLKGAQLPGGDAPAGPAAAAAPAMSGAEEMIPEDAGGTGDPKEELPELLTQAENTLADIRHAVEALLEEPGSELAEYEELAGEMPREAQLLKLQKKVGSAVLVGMQKASSELESNIEELRMAQHIRANRTKIDAAHYKYASELTEELVGVTKNTLADCFKLMQAFVKYARGTEAILKRAQDPMEGLGGEFTMIPMNEEQQREEWAQQKAENAAKKQKGSGYEAVAPPQMPNLPGVMPEGLSPEMEQDWLMRSRPGRDAGLGSMLESGTAEGRSGADAAEGTSPTLTPESSPALSRDPGYQTDDGDEGDETMDENNLELELGNAKLVTDASDKAARATRREKLAQKGLKFQKELSLAHPGGGVTTQLDVKPEGDLAKVETLEEQHAKHMEVALAPPKPRTASAHPDIVKAADDIQELVTEGVLNPTDAIFAELIAEGLDAEAVKYWKQYFGQAKDGGTQFAAELVKEHAAKKKAEQEETIRVKIARAYELANDMVHRGMLANDKEAVKAQVDEVLKFDENGFDSFKNFVSRQPVKKASGMPQVGQLMSTAEIMIPAPAARQDNLQMALEEVFANSPLKSRMF